MSILLAPARNVKTATAILFVPAFTRRMMNPAFGRFPQREARLPIGPTTADLDAIRGACPATAPTDGECIDRFYSQTMSPAEYRDFLAHARSAEMDRYSACDQAERDELGIAPDAEPSFSDDLLDAMARESAELDAVSGHDFSRPTPSPVKARKLGRKVETLHTRHRAARLMQVVA
jgi:hypothetical protein